MESSDRLTAVLARISKLAMLVFFAGFGLVIAVAFAPSESRIMALLAWPVVVLMIASSVTYLTAIMLRDAVTQKWRFSLGAMLVATTLIAVVLAAIAAIVRGS